MSPKAKLVFGFLLFLSSGVSWAQVAVPDSHHVHRHRLIGSRAKTGMFHATILYFHADPARQLDFILAQQNAEEVSRAADFIEKNTLALKAEASQTEGEILSEDIRGTLETCARAKDEAQALRRELAKKQPSQEAVRKHAQVLFHRMKKILGYHQSAEAKFGIVPTPDPPAPPD